uniref:Uncharacterized protein n=1 Tax=Oryza sativa subsp. japonica TaxID=39947 RepID=Q5VMY3_ORYSJ|nr:hypothetical protein [Oryza sativa Japonica Group]BAD69192.1 hypothetical protein [Oryza sativa Japonica Group]
MGSCATGDYGGSLSCSLSGAATDDAGGVHHRWQPGLLRPGQQMPRRERRNRRQLRWPRCGKGGRHAEVGVFLPPLSLTPLV